MIISIQQSRINIAALYSLLCVISIFGAEKDKKSEYKYHRLATSSKDVPEWVRPKVNLEEIFRAYIPEDQQEKTAYASFLLKNKVCGIYAHTAAMSILVHANSKENANDIVNSLKKSQNVSYPCILEELICSNYESNSINASVDLRYTNPFILPCTVALYYLLGDTAYGYLFKKKDKKHYIAVKTITPFEDSITGCICATLPSCLRPPCYPGHKKITKNFDYIPLIETNKKNYTKYNQVSLDDDTLTDYVAKAFHLNTGNDDKEQTTVGVLAYDGAKWLEYLNKFNNNKHGWKEPNCCPVL